MGSRGQRQIDPYTVEHVEWCSVCQVEWTWRDSDGDADPVRHPHDHLRSLAERVAALEKGTKGAP